MDESFYGLNMVVFGKSKSGKALALDTPLPTPDGWTTIGDVRPGDQLFNAEGEITEVVAVGPVWDDRPCRRVSVKGDSIVADIAHVWRATRPRGDNLGRWALVETGELRVGSYMRKLPWTPALQLPERVLPLDPYILGVWLGDGAVKSGLIGGVCKEKLPVLERCLELHGGDGKIQQRQDGNYTLHLSGLTQRLTDMGARRPDGDRFVKRIPPEYLRASIEQRRELLAGLLDTDGEFQEYRAVFSFSNTSLHLAERTAELACSLGIRAEVKGPFESWAVIGESRIRGADHYRVPLRGVVASHRITHRPDRECHIPESRHRTYERNTITEVAEVESVPVRCIQVSDLHGMFLAGRTMIPTHNSWMGDTTPAPRLVLDAESGSRFTPSRKTVWNPAQPPPQVDGTWDTAIVPVHKFRDVNSAYEWLNSGKHPFRSVVLDSVSEIQQRAVDDIAGTQLMKTQDWGQLLRVCSDLIRKFRDLVTNPVRPLDAVIFIAMARQRSGDGAWGPYVQGQLATVLPYFVDVAGYLDVVSMEDGSQTRRLYIGNFPGFETGERVGGRLGTYVDNPSVASMLAAVRGGGETAAVPAAPQTRAASGEPELSPSDPESGGPSVAPGNPW